MHTAVRIDNTLSAAKQSLSNRSGIYSSSKAIRPSVTSHC